MRRIGWCIIAATILCALVLPVLAASNEYGDWSDNGNAYAYVKGWWVTIDHYYKTYHLGEVENVGDNPYTKFEGWYGSQNGYYQIIPLSAHSGYYQTYYETPRLIKTYTDSKTGGSSGRVTVLLAPGLEP